MAHGLIDNPTPSVVPYTDSIAPTECHAERYRSSSLPDCCLYAILALVGHAWFRMLCATTVSLRRVGAFLFFVFFIVPGAVCFRSSATTGVLVHVHPSGNAYPKRYFLSVERGSDPWYQGTPGLVCCVLQQSVYVRSCAFLCFGCFARTWS